MKAFLSLAIAILLCAVVPAHAGPVDSKDYIDMAVDTLRPYLADEMMAPVEGPEIRQVEQDIYDLQDSSLTTTIAERRKKLNDDIANLYARDKWLEVHPLI